MNYGFVCSKRVQALSQGISLILDLIKGTVPSRNIDGGCSYSNLLSKTTYFIKPLVTLPLETDSIEPKVPLL